MMQTLLQDMRYGARMLVKNPGFTLIAVFTLALGIGANTAIFSVVNAVLLRPLPYAEPERLVWLWGNVRGGTSRASVSPPDFLDYREQNRSFEQLGAFYSPGISVNLTGDGEPERLRGSAVTANYFDLLGVKPALGRAFVAEEEAAGRSQVVILNHGLWQRRFGADPAIIGKTITLNDSTFNVIGVAPAGFEPPQTAELWIPLPFRETESDRGAHSLRAIGRLKPGVTIEQAQAETDLVSRRMEEQYPETNANRNLLLEPLHERLIGNLGRQLWMLFGAVVFVLLIACANVANLLLARAASRSREIAIRAAVGASRSRVARQLLAESLLLSLCGGALGVLVGVLGLKLLLSISAGNIPPWAQAGIDARALGFTLLATLLTGLLFGLAPAFQASKPDLAESLKEGGGGSTESARLHRIRGLWVISEVALAVVTLIGAGLLIKSFIRLQQVNPGFDAKNALTLRLELPPARYRSPEQVTDFYDQLKRRLAALPGAQAVGMTSYLPLGGQGVDNEFKIEGRPYDPNRHVTADDRRVDHEYFRAMNIPLLRGRGFTEQEARMRGRVVIISEMMARRFFANEDPVGQRLLLVGDAPGVSYEIIGVVGDVRERALHREVYQMMYFPTLRQRETNLVIRTAIAPTNLIADARKAVHAVDKNLPVFAIRPMEELLADSVAQQHLNTLLLSAFAALALFLAAVGVYGVVSQAVSQGTREIGVRIALGAQRRDVLLLVIAQGMKLVVPGLTLGMLAALGLNQWMSALLYDVRPADPATFGAIAALLMVVALLACYIPARRATKVDPMVALKCE